MEERNITNRRMRTISFCRHFLAESVENMICQMLRMRLSGRFFFLWSRINKEKLTGRSVPERDPEDI